MGVVFSGRGAAVCSGDRRGGGEWPQCHGTLHSKMVTVQVLCVFSNKKKKFPWAGQWFHPRKASKMTRKKSGISERTNLEVSFYRRPR